MANEIVLEKRSDGIAILTLNRPEAMNAINRAMVRKLRVAIRDVESDEAVDVVIVAGSGGKAFCVGIDLKERQTLSDEDAAVLRLEEMFPMYSELEEIGRAHV